MIFKTLLYKDIHTYMHEYTHMYSCMYTRMHICTHTHHTHTHTHTTVYICTHTTVHILHTTAHICTHTHNSAYMYTHTQQRIYVHTHIHTHNSAHVHIPHKSVYTHPHTTVLLIACGACINGPYQIITTAVSIDLVCIYDLTKCGRRDSGLVYKYSLLLQFEIYANIRYTSKGFNSWDVAYFDLSPSLQFCITNPLNEGCSAW